MQEQIDAITMKGNPLTLVGPKIEIGQQAPDAQLVNKALEPVKLSSFFGKICVITCFPSLDTSVCDMMTRRFNEEAVSLDDNAVVLAISMDLPFAQDRWCIAADVKNVFMLSDHRNASFGQAYGVLIKDLRLLGRGVFVVDKTGIVRSAEIVKELTGEPNYDSVLEVIKKLL